jgi:hypothetical protein
MIIQIKVNLQVFWKDKTNQELTSLAAVNCIEPLKEYFYQYLERILLLLEIIDGIAYGISSFESCSLMAFFILLMISNTNKNIYGITNEILSLKSCSLNFFIPLMISNTYKNSNGIFC